MRLGYNEYMAHHYAYMTRVAEVREPESYAEAAKDANWHATMEEEMRALAENVTWDLLTPQRVLSRSDVGGCIRSSTTPTAPLTDTRPG